MYALLFSQAHSNAEINVHFQAWGLYVPLDSLQTYIAEMTDNIFYSPVPAARYIFSRNYPTSEMYKKNLFIWGLGY